MKQLGRDVKRTVFFIIFRVTRNHVYIRPGFVATPLLSGDGRYPMLMRTEKVAARIMHVLRHPRRRVVIDRRYALMVFFWKLIPEWLWERLNIRKDD